MRFVSLEGGAASTILSALLDEKLRGRASFIVMDNLRILIIVPVTTALVLVECRFTVHERRPGRRLEKEKRKNGRGRKNGTKSKIEA
jgi:hypothetical protein